MEQKENVQRAYRRIRGCLTVFFCLVLLAPLLTLLSGPAQTVSEDEKRRLAAFPEFRFSREYSGEFETWFNDHFGLRSWFVLGHNTILVKLFNTSPVDHVICGQDGWLFYNGNRLKEDFMGQDPFTDDVLAHWETVIKKRTKELQEKGISYFLLVAPNKQTVYPEYLPVWMQKKQGRARFDQMSAYFTLKEMDCLVDLRDTLLNEKKEGQVYFETDTHWNSKGAYAACCELSRRLEKRFPGEVFLDKGAVDADMKGEAKSRDLAVMVGLSKVLKEKDQGGMYVTIPCAVPITSLDLPYIGSMWYEKPFARGCPLRKRRAVVFRDSFAEFMEPFLSEMFETVVYVWKRYDPDVMKQLIDEVNPDVVIEEVVERFLLTPPM